MSPSISGANMTEAISGDCPICGASVERGTYCSAACRRLASRARQDPIGTVAMLMRRLSARCAGCGTSLAHKRAGSRWCGETCRAAHRVQNPVSAT